MKTWFASLNGVITLSLVALLIFMGRTFIDFQYVYVEFFPNPGEAALAILVNMALFGGWFWALLKASHGSRRGLMGALIFDLLFVLLLSVGTLFFYCPSPCDTAWPLAEIINWASLIVGLLAAVAVWLRLRRSVG